jgi:hypothetical protein
MKWFVELGFVHDADCRGFDFVERGAIHTARPLAEKRVGGEAMSLAFSVSALFSLEAVYVLTGVVLLIFAALTLLDRSNPQRFGTAAFWSVLGLIFALGGVLPYWLTGLLVLFLVALDGAGQVGKGEAPAAQPQASIGNRIFCPVLAIPLVTFAFAIVFRLLKLDANRGALVGLGFGGLVAMLLVLRLTGSRRASCLTRGDAQRCDGRGQHLAAIAGLARCDFCGGQGGRFDCRRHSARDPARQSVFAGAGELPWEWRSLPS